eukprot:evm.model.scf_1352.2 EVM.evm.TU.scf_1352.2   scf_1352:13996-16242(+)
MLVIWCPYQMDGDPDAQRSSRVLPTLDWRATQREPSVPPKGRHNGQVPQAASSVCLQPHVCLAPVPGSAVWGNSAARINMHPVPWQANKVVILLSGRYSGKKAVIVKTYDDGTSGRMYGHALVCGLAKEPRRVSELTRLTGILFTEGWEGVGTFIKLVNYNHMMPTRYALDVDLKNVVTSDAIENSTKKAEARKAAKDLLEDKFKTGKNRWFFSKLYF